VTPEALAACAQGSNPVRPTFCNVPEWAQVFLYIAGAIAVGIFAYGIWRHARTWAAGAPTPAERSSGGWGLRARRFARYAVGQTKTNERRLPALFHTGIFWGFVLLFIGTVLATLDWDVAHLLLGTRFLTGTPYLVYELVLDAAGIAFILGLFVAMWRRYFVAPHHIRGSWDFVLWSLLIINVSGFLVEGFRLAIAPVSWGGWSFAGQMIADVVHAGPQWLLDAIPSVHFGLWLTHAVAAFVFIAAIPYTNAVHMVNTAANATLQPAGALKPGVALVPIDIQTAETYGVGELSQFTVKQRLSADSCLRCGRCEVVCPAYMSGSPLNPKRVIVNLSEGVRAEADMPPEIGAAGTAAATLPLIGVPGLIDPDALWGCTTCMACVEVCPAFIEIVDDIVDMRRYLALMEGTLPGTAGATLRNMASAGNPWGYAPESRREWAAGLDVPVAAPGKHVEVLYFVGCSGSYDKRNQRIARAVAQLLTRAGVSFAVLEKERCNAESARRLGEEYLYQTATEENVANLNALSFDRVVTHCPHCFNTIRNEYGQFGGDYDVIHHTQLIGELVEAGRLPAIDAADLESGAAGRPKVAFHDSCYLGRYNGEFQAPRAVLTAAGVKLQELDRNRENGLCCGGGGGKMWFEAPQATSVGQIRMTEALAYSPDVVGVACPFCLTMLDSARSSMGATTTKIMDVAEVYLAALDGENAETGVEES
jgi:Fe-S oxidoreductase